MAEAGHEVTSVEHEVMVTVSVSRSVEVSWARVVAARAPRARTQNEERILMVYCELEFGVA